MANGQDWTDTLDARAAGKVLGFSESGAPVDTADVPPDEREVLDVKFYAAVEAPPAADARDARIAELEAQLREQQDARIAELEQQIAAEQTPAPATTPATTPATPAATEPATPTATLAATEPATPTAPSFPAPVPGDVTPAQHAAATATAQGDTGPSSSAVPAPGSTPPAGRPQQ